MPSIIGQAQQTQTARDNLLFIGSNSAPFLRWYILENGVMRQLPTPSSPPPATVRGISVSKDGKLLFVSHDSGGTTNNISVYAINGLNSLQKVSYNFATAIGNGQSVNVDASGQFVALGLTVSPWLKVFRLNSDFTTTDCTGFSSLTNPATAVAFSPDGLALAVGFNIGGVGGGECLRVWNRTTTTATAFTERTLSGKWTVTSCFGIAWPRNDYVVYSSSTNDLTTAIQGFTRSGNAFSRAETISTQPAANCRQVASSAGGGLLAFSQSAAPFIQQYTLKQDTFTQVSVGNPAGQSVTPVLTGTVLHCRFSRDGRFLAAGGNDGFRLYVNTYPVSGAMITIPSSEIGTTTDAAWWPRAEDLF